MKRFLLIALSILIALSLFACGKTEAPAFTGKAGTGEPALTGETHADTAPAETAVETEEQTPVLNENDLETLFDRNLNCVLNVFYLGNLQYEQEGENGLHRVNDPRFGSFVELENYVRETYVTEVAERLLYEERVPGHTLYVNRGGELYIDETVLGGVGYYVDWSRYTITVESMTDTSCTFTVTASITEPGDNVSPQPYVKNVTAVVENGAWVLSDVVY